MKIVAEGKRYETDNLISIHEVRREEGTGVFRTHVWMAPKSGRIIVETYSCWENRRRPGTCMGTQYHVADLYEISELWRELKDDRLADLLPEGE